MASPLNRVAVAAVATLLLVTAVGCGSSGRELRDATPGATAPPRKPPAAGTLPPGSSTTLATLFAITTDAWTPGGPMPASYTCEGADTSPPFVLSKIPEGTTEMALVVTDKDAGGLVHWVVAGIPPTTTLIPEGAPPAGAVQTLNGNGELGWMGPCPKDGKVHNYEFDLYALNAPSGVVEGQEPQTAIQSIVASSTERSQFTGSFKG